MELGLEYREWKNSNQCLVQLYKETYAEIFGNVSMSGTDVVIDYGCGAGDIIKNFIAPFVDRVIGVDVSENMIRLAKEANHGSENVEFLLGDFETLRQYCAVFDKFVSIFVICYFEDPRAFLLSASSLIKPSGILAFTIPLIKDQSFVAEVFHQEKWRHRGANGHLQLAKWMYNYTELPDIRPAVQDAGFCIVKYSVKTYRIEFDSIGQLFKLLTVWDPLFTRVPTRDREEFFEDLKHYALNHLDQGTIEVGENGMASFMYNAVVVIAKKL